MVLHLHADVREDVGRRSNYARRLRQQQVTVFSLHVISVNGNDYEAGAATAALCNDQVFRHVKLLLNIEKLSTQWEIICRNDTCIGYCVGVRQ